jgi:hypothetical protein
VNSEIRGSQVRVQVPPSQGSGLYRRLRSVFSFKWSHLGPSAWKSAPSVKLLPRLRPDEQKAESKPQQQLFPVFKIYKGKGGASNGAGAVPYTPQKRAIFGSVKLFPCFTGGNNCYQNPKCVTKWPLWARYEWLFLISFRDRAS